MHGPARVAHLLLFAVLCPFATAGDLEDFLKDAPKPEAEDTHLSAQLYRWAKAGAGEDALIRRAAAEFDLPPALARELVPLAMRRESAPRYSKDQSKREAVADELAALRKRWPTEWAPVEEQGRMIDDVGVCDEPAALEALVESWPDPAEARRRLMTIRPCPSLLAPPTGAAPADFAVHRDFAIALNDWQGLEPLTFAALQVAIDKGEATGADPAGIARLRALLIAGFVEQNRPDVVVAALPAEDDPAFAPLLPALSAETRLDLAAVFAGRDDEDAARRWLQRARTATDIPNAVPPASETSDYDRDQAAAHAQLFANRVVLLQRLLDGSDEDAFSLLTAGWDHFLDGSNPGGGVWSEAYRRVAVADGYPELASLQRPTYRQRFESYDDDCFRCNPEIPAELARLQAIEPPPRGVAAADATDPRPPALLATMQAQLAPTAGGWQETVLPDTLRTPASNCGGGDDEALSPPDCGDAPADPAWREKLPYGELVRWQQDGERIVAVFASQALDPVGELSSGGYWIALSDDAGASFAEPLYTGLQVYSPYVVRPVSKVPLLADGVLQLEVHVRELDVAKLTLPPVSLPLRREADDVLLSMPLADLSRDGDSDGIADTIERAMLLDPASADTDGDGSADGVDTLPQLPARPGATDPRTEALLLVLQELLGEDAAAIVTTDAHSGGADPAAAYALGRGTVSRKGNGAMFLVADPRGFERLDLRERVVLLSDAQAEALRARRGAFMATSLTLVLDHDGRRGFAVWNAKWTGATYRLSWRGRDGWELETVSSWITDAGARSAPAYAAR